jgi:hypothetical protein
MTIIIIIELEIVDIAHDRAKSSRAVPRRLRKGCLGPLASSGGFLPA